MLVTRANRNGLPTPGKVDFDMTIDISLLSTAVPLIGQSKPTRSHPQQAVTLKLSAAVIGRAVGVDPVGVVGSGRWG
jgi:hypothetical protein